MDFTDLENIKTHLKSSYSMLLKGLPCCTVQLQSFLKYGVQGLRQFCSKRKKKFTVSIEGNIGCGKSTLLNYFQSCPTVEALKEPVAQWTDLQGHNPLKLLYEDPERWCFSFNNYAMLTRLEMHKYKPQVPVKMIERSLYSTKYIFVENSYRQGLLTDLENAVLSEWFNHIDRSQSIDVDLFVYLRAPPDVCYERLRSRNRKEEAGVPYEFIETLHTLHEEWLMHQRSHPVPGPVLVLDASHELPRMQQLYEEYRSEILCGCTHEVLKPPKKDLDTETTNDIETQTATSFAH